MNASAGLGGTRAGDRFLDLVCDPGQETIDAGRIMAVFAHPDDETVAIGGQLPRLRGIRFVCVTDGAPIRMDDALASGFSRREDYAAARRREIVAALGEAGISADAVLMLGAVDQRAAHDMARLARQLADLFHSENTAVAITHAYEGGHPDHDATALIVHAAARLIADAGGDPLGIVECPLYHRREGRRWFQEFAPADGAGVECRVELSEEAVELKRRMLAAHVSQQRLLAAMSIGPEPFRLAPAYDFSALPNNGELLYEEFGWDFRGDDWLRCAGKTREELGLPRWF